MSHLSNQSQEEPLGAAVEIDMQNVPLYLSRLAQGSRSLNVDDQQPLRPEMDSVRMHQQQFNNRDEKERMQASAASLDEARNLRRHQNALFRPHSRIGNERQIARESPVQKIVSLEDPNTPMTDIMCALEKQEYIQSQVDRRLLEAKAAGFKGNATLERARALRTGTIMPRKTNLGQGNGAGSALLVGNNQAVPNGFRKSSASYEVSHNERNNFLRLATGVEFEGEKCQRMARKERGRIAPKPIPEPPPGFLPGGGRFMTEKERLDYAYDNPDRAGNFAMPFKPINPNQWTDRPVSYRPEIRHNWEDEIPIFDPPTAGAFMQPEPIGRRVAADDPLPYRGMPGESYSAVEEQQLRAPRDESRMAPFKKDIGPVEPRFAYSASYDDDMIERSEKMPVYEIVKPKVERKNLERTTVDSITRGINLVDETALYDPTVATPIGLQSSQMKRDEKAVQSEQTAMEAARQQFQSARLIGDNTQSAVVNASLQKNITGEKATERGLQREQVATKALQDNNDFNSRFSIGGDPDMFHDNMRSTLAQQSLAAQEDSKRYLRARIMEQKTQAGMVGDRANIIDEQRYVDTAASRTAAEALNSFSTGTAKRAANDRAQAQRNFERVNDAMQRVRLSMTDGDSTNYNEYGSAADRVAQQNQTQSKAYLLAAKTRQLEMQMMDNANRNNNNIQLDDAFIDMQRPMASTQTHRETGTQGSRVMAREVATMQNARQNAQRANLIDDNGDQFGDSVERTARAMTSSTRNMVDAVSAQKAQLNEKNTLQQARFQASRASAFDDVDPQSVGRASQMLSTSLENKALLAQKEAAAQTRVIQSQLDMSTFGDNSASRLVSDGFKAPQSTEMIQRGQVRALNSMRLAAESMQAQNFGSGLDLQNFSMNTSANVKEMDTKRQVLADQRVMNKVNESFTALDETHGATAYQESLLRTETERLERTNERGLQRERGMLANDAAARSTLRLTDVGTFEHHTIDSAIGSEPRGGQAAFDSRNARREELVQDVATPNYDAVSDYLTVEHVLQRLDADVCHRPKAGLKAERQNAYQKNFIAQEKGVPTHLLPKEMFPRHKKTYTPRGSPCASPIPR